MWQMLLQQHMYLPSREALSGQRWGDDTSWFHPRETMLALFCPPWSREIFDIPQNRVSVRYKNPFLAHINASQSIMLVPHFSKPHKNFLHWCEDGEMWQRQESDSPVLYVWPLWQPLCLPGQIHFSSHARWRNALPWICSDFPRQDYKTSTVIWLNNSHFLEGTLYSLPIFIVDIFGWTTDKASSPEAGSCVWDTVAKSNGRKVWLVLKDKTIHSSRNLDVLCTHCSKSSGYIILQVLSLAKAEN